MVLYNLAGLKNVKHRGIKFILLPPIAFTIGAGLGVLVCFATYDGCFSNWDQFSTTPPEKATKIIAVDPSGIWVETKSKRIYHNVWDANNLTTVWELSSPPTQSSTSEIGGYIDYKPACTLMLGIVDKKAICNNPCGEASMIHSYALRYNGDIYSRAVYAGSGLGLLAIMVYGPIGGVIVFGIPLVILFSFTNLADYIYNWY
ncbi:MAG: hypothetical protein JW908_02995 [Anaerolineales bacterium]|nr:hypothetical protein [Anaerolineales bacterium]